jgi:hypothetical protein
MSNFHNKLIRTFFPNLKMKLLFVELITIYNNLKHQKIYNKTCNVYVFLLKTKAMINAQNLTIKKITI